MNKNNLNSSIISNWGKSRKPLVIMALIASIGILSFIALFIGLSPRILFMLYGILVAIPLMIILVNRDLLWGLSAWFLLVPFSKVGKISFPMFPDVEPHRLVWILIFLFFLAQIALNKRGILPITKTETAMILFCVVCLVSMARAKTLFEVGQGLTIRSFLEGYAMPFFIFFLTKNIVKKEDQIKRLFQVLLVIGVYLTLTGIFEHYHLKGLVFPRYIMDPNLHVHWGRARGPFINSAVNGAVIGTIFLSSLYLIIHMSKSRARNLYAVFVALMPLTIYFTYTRSTWLGFVLSLLIIPLFFPRLRKFFLLMLFVVFILVISNWANVRSEDRTRGGVAFMGPIYARMQLYNTSLRMFLDKPVLGFGFGTFREKSYDYLERIKGIPIKTIMRGRHDTLVGILVELGLAGFIPLILIFFYIFKHSFRLYHKLNQESFLGKGLVVIFWGMSIIFLVTILTIEVRFFLLLNSIFYLLAGILVGLDQRMSLGENFNNRIHTNMPHKK